MALHPSSRLSPRAIPVLALALAVVSATACTGAPTEAPPAATAATAADAPADAKAPSANSATAKGLRGLASLAGGKWPSAPIKPWTFDFKDPPASPRAPSTVAFGATIGTTMYPEVEALVQKLGLSCADTSVRAMMDRRREIERAKVADADARGEDAVTSASWVNKRSKRESNPQLRFSCPKVTSDQLTDRKRPPSSGRLLYIFDDAAYPLRHASYQRTHRDHAAAYADYQEAVAALTKLYGPPTKPLTGTLPVPDKDGKVEFPASKNLEVTWEYGDLLARVNVLRYGELITVGERVEVPHGLRPDSPVFVAGKTPPLPPPLGATMPPLPGAPAPAPAAPAPAAPAPAAPAAAAPAPAAPAASP